MRLPVFVLAALFSGSVLAEDQVPLLDDINSIYVPGSFDIPDQPADQDGLRDRPRYAIWPEEKAKDTGDPGLDISLIRKRVLLLLDWQSGLAIKAPVAKSRVYRVPVCSAESLPKGTKLE